MKQFAKKYTVDLVMCFIGAVVTGCSALFIDDIAYSVVSLCITLLFEISLILVRQSIDLKLKSLIQFEDDRNQIERELSAASIKKETFINILDHIESDNKRRVLKAIDAEYNSYCQTLDYIGKGYYPIRPHDKRDRSLYLRQKRIINSTKSEICATHHVDSTDNLDLWDVSREGYNYPSFKQHIFLPIELKSQTIFGCVGRRLFIVPDNGYSSLHSSLEIWRRVIRTQMQLKFQCRYLTKERETEILRNTESISSGHSDDLLIGDDDYCFIYRQDSSWSISAFETISPAAAEECKRVFELLWDCATPLAEAEGNYSFFRDLTTEEPR